MDFRSIPHPGQRIARSAFAVLLCFVLYYLRGQTGAPFYSALAVLQCIQPYRSATLQIAANRTKGTFIGAAWGMLALVIQLRIPEELFFLNYVVISLFVALVLYSTVILNNRASSYFSCVVFLSITVNHLTDANPYLFVVNRVADTLIGIFIAFAVNSLHLPRRHRKDILFVSGIDDTIVSPDNSLSDYSRVEINRLLDSGLHFTVATTETPATVRESLPGVRFRLPIIAMDGAVLYNMEEHAYLLKRTMRPEQALRMEAALTQADAAFFTNTIADDLLVIYYTALSNPAMDTTYRECRKSVYRNYRQQSEPVFEDVVYYLVLDVPEKIEELVQSLQRCAGSEDYRFVTQPYTRCPGYWSLKIYDRSATRPNMVRQLMDRIGLQKKITFGSIEGLYDVTIHNAAQDSMVKHLKKLYEPVIWSKTDT